MKGFLEVIRQAIDRKWDISGDKPGKALGEDSYPPIILGMSPKAIIGKQDRGWHASKKIGAMRWNVTLWILKGLHIFIG